MDGPDFPSGLSGASGKDSLLATGIKENALQPILELLGYSAM
jgi:hypothetical protein